MIASSGSNRAGDERREARPGGVSRAGELGRVDAQLGLDMGGERVMLGEMLTNLPGQRRRQALGLIEAGQLGYLRVRGLGELAALPDKHRPLRVPLAGHRDVLSGCHRQRASEQPG